ncbi:ArsR/SmtB family transcription factor [Nannocystaceae bacterium ST9]
MIARAFKDRVYEQLARVGKALAAPKRLELLDLLAQGPRTVDALARQVDLPIANASAHLKVLRGARLVETEKRGLYVEYRLADEQVALLCHTLRELAVDRLGEIDDVTRGYLDERGAMEAIDADDLLRRVEAGEVRVIDVRPHREYLAGHIPGALSIPLEELAGRLAELPGDREIVAYCRGPWCVMAIDAVELLRAHGFEARRMDLGVVDWRARGRPVERGVGA